MITYDQFIANADAEDIRVLNLLAQAQEIKFNVAAEADAMFQRITRLDSAGFVLRINRAYFRVDGTVWQAFSALIDPAASTYLALAASERVTLSRLPLPGAAPVANFTWSGNALIASFTSTATDSDGSVVAWAWNFGDGGTSTAQNPQHTYLLPGTYSVTLTVTDNTGMTHNVTKQIAVQVL